MAALAAGSVAAPVLVTIVGSDLAFVFAGCSLPIFALTVRRRIRTVDRDAVAPDPADIALLRGTSIFGPLGPASLERVARHLIPVAASAGTILIREGDPGDRFYLIADGSLSVSRGGAELAILGPGDFVGEIALLQDVPRTATVTATAPTTLRALDREHFLAALTGSPAGAVALSEEMDRRLATHDEPGG